MAEIEDSYQQVAERFLQRTGPLSAEDSEAVSRMYCLWNTRHHFREAPQQPLPAPPGFIQLSQPVDKDTEEYLEKNGVTTMRSNGELGARHLWATVIRLHLDEALERMPEALWHCVHFNKDNVIVPDRFAEFGYVPHLPDRAFIAAPFHTLPFAEIERRSLAQTHSYYFQFDPLI